MRRLLALKLAWLLFLAIATCAVTSSVIAQARRTKATDVPAANPPRLTATVKSGPLPAAARVRDAHTVSEHAMTSLKLSAVGNTLSIDASAHIYDRRPGVAFVWAVRVVDPKDAKKTLFERRYDHQLFTLPANMELKPTFSDRIELALPRGIYPIECVVYEVHPELGVAGLNDPTTAKASIGSSRKQAVEIGN